MSAKQWNRVFTSGSKWKAGAPKRKISERDSSHVASLEQMYLDFGQRSFGRQVTCSQCGMRYCEGEPTDEEEHRKHHRRALAGVVLRGGAAERLVSFCVCLFLCSSQCL